jgi:hypothetical protein
MELMSNIYNTFIKHCLGWAPVAHTCIILGTQEAEIRRIVVQSQPRQIVTRSYLGKTHHKKSTGGVAPGVGPESNPSTANKRTNIV